MRLLLLTLGVSLKTFASVNTVSSPVDDFVSGKVFVISDSYLTAEPNSLLNQSQLVSVDFNGAFDFKSWSFVTDFQAGHYTDVNNSYLAVREMNFKYAVYENSVSLQFGRKYENWSSASKAWGLSLWEPDFAVDPLRAVHQGLTGLFLNYSSENFYLTGFASSIYVPNLGPEAKPNNEGRIEIQNRWAKKPDSHFPFNGKSTQIFYSLDLPSINKIISQKSLAVHTRFGNPKAGAWTSFSWGQKPVNDLVFSYQGILRLRDDGSYGDVKIVPVVIEHEITSFDLGYQWLSHSLIFSHLAEKPKNLRPQAGWNMQQFQPIKVNALHWNWSLFHYLNEEIKISIGRMFLTGGETTDIDVGGEESHAMDGSRVRFKNAWSLDLQSPLYGKTRTLISGTLRFVRDMIQSGSLLNAEILFKPTVNLNFQIGTDIIGVQDNTENNRSKEFLNVNRANDRIYGGVTYVF